jgi:uncharacterized membrane protein YqjE
MRTVPSFSRDVPLGGLLRRLAERTTALGEAQIGMARAELARDFEAEVRRLRVLFAAMLLVAFGLQLLVVAVVLVLATRLEAWLATLLVSAPLLVAGVAVLLAARSRAGGPFLERTLEALGEDLRWLRSLLR